MEPEDIADDLNDYGQRDNVDEDETRRYEQGLNDAGLASPSPAPIHSSNGRGRLRRGAPVQAAPTRAPAVLQPVCQAPPSTFEAGTGLPAALEKCKQVQDLLGDGPAAAAAITCMVRSSPRTKVELGMKFD